jgi:hypothetical protein
MTTTPTGNPAWTRSADHTFYGGDVNKRDYADLPVVNPQTDVGASDIQRTAADMAAVSRMADFAQLDLTMASGSAAPTVNAVRLMTGEYAGSGYSGTSPPTGFPTVTGVADGVVDIQFSASYEDPYSVSGTYQPSFPTGSISGNTGPGGRIVAAWTSGTDTVRVKVMNSAGTGQPNHQVSVRVA